MQTSRKGRIELAGHEGIALTKYRDSVGVWTIALGATRSEIPDLASWPLDKALTIKEAMDLFTVSLGKYEKAINSALKVKVSQQQFDALVSICYNIGTGGAAKSTFMRRINAGRSKEEVADAIMMWNKPKEIIGRRSKEATLYKTGVYSNGGKATIFPVIGGKPVYRKGKVVNVEDYL